MPTSTPTTATPTPSTTGCGQKLFIDGIQNWTEVIVAGGGMDAIRSAIDTSDKNKPTRITIKAGTYKGRCLYIEDHMRSEKSPLWVRAEGVVQVDCNDGNGQAIGLEHASYMAFEGLTIGPAQGHYGDSAIHISGKPIDTKNRASYGRYDPSHHVIVRNLTARNLNRGSDGDSNPDAYESGCCDAVKANQSEYIWILDSHVSRTARHGFDMVGVHHAVVCNNVLTDMVGAGFGMEAKGGSQDIVFERNTLRRVRNRGIVLGGEGTDNVFMWPSDAKYEGAGEIARNNLIVDASEGGIGFFGCHGCTAIANTIWITPGLRSQTKDMVRMFPSTLENAGDYWGGPKRVGEVLINQNNRLLNNVLGAAGGDMTCALEAGEKGVAGLQMHHNLWWNGGKPLPTCGDGTTSIQGYPDRASFFGNVDPKLTSVGSPAVLPDARPSKSSPIVRAGVADSALPSVDLAGKPRPSTPTLGALEP